VASAPVDPEETAKERMLRKLQVPCLARVSNFRFPSFRLPDVLSFCLPLYLSVVPAFLLASVRPPLLPLLFFFLPISFLYLVLHVAVLPGALPLPFPFAFFAFLPPMQSQGAVNFLMK
jgi:hypothetical protein